MTASSGNEAVANGRDFSTYESGQCQKFVRGPCWEVGSLYGSAIEAWNGAAEKHKGDRTPPIGAPCYYSGGTYGHAVIYVGNGNVRSTDTPSSGKVGEKPISYYETEWGKTYLGWTGDINGVDLPISDSGSSGGDYPKPSGKTVYLDKLHYGQKDSDSVWHLQNVLNGHKLSGGQTLPTTGNYLDETDEEVRLCQQQHGYGNDPAKKSFVGEKQANHLFGGKGYTIKE